MTAISGETGYTRWRGPLALVSIATLLSSVGSGAWLTVQVLYLVQSAHLSVAQVGAGLCGAGLIGMATAAPLGRLADRYDPRLVTVWILALESVAAAGFLLARSFWLFLVVTAIVAVLERGGSAVRGAVLAALFKGAERVRARAAIRRMYNLGAAAGAGLGALVLNHAGAGLYTVCILANAVTYALAAGLNLLLPQTRTAPAVPAGAKMAALRDRPFWCLTALNAVVTLHYPVLTLALPLWVAQHTRLPLWTSAAALGLNTVLVAVLQLRAARGTEDVRVAAVRMRHAGIAIGVGCLLFAATSRLPAVAASLLLLVAVIVYTLGELWHAAGASGLAFGLAPDRDQGQYQGVFGMGTGLAQTVAPPLVMLLATHWQEAGWLVLAVIVAIAGAAVPGFLRVAYGSEHSQGLSRKEVKEEHV
ncbi:MFS transporter [Streptomyces virginiae]|uniref:MFS transporter n=1 Tax=Streptomyces virginiae TaxID=1961 RepID=UPI0036655D11